MLRTEILGCAIMSSIQVNASLISNLTGVFDISLQIYRRLLFLPFVRFFLAQRESPRVTGCSDLEATPLVVELEQNS